MNDTATTPEKPAGPKPGKERGEPKRNESDEPGNTGGAPVDEIDFDGNGQRTPNEGDAPPPERDSRTP